MTAHKHAEMIKAKADNMALVVFMLNDSDHGWLKVSDNWQLPHFYEGQQYFLCHPKHERECLHWLNGGEVQAVFNLTWTDSLLNARWSTAHPLMNEQEKIRIKPRKEKRWIGIYRGEFPAEKTMGTLQDVQEYVLSPHYKHCAPEGWQFIQIEVEV